ncbi:MAG: porin family protein [Gammaproteobacteria bacterium]|nr:porin family protein [Gammaproteobacteria bacterium]
MRSTNKFFAVLAVTLLSLTQISSVFAEGSKPLLDKNKFSIGAGLSLNSVSGPADDELGFQFFGAYNLTQVNLMEGVYSSVEFGVMDYGFNNDSTGIWGTYVIDGGINGRLGWLARLGLDIGDDDGVMLGAGVDFALNKQLDMRVEYVIRDEIDSLQFNVIFNL